MLKNIDIYEFSKRPLVINIEIPDEDIIQETITYIHYRVSKTLNTPQIDENHREFLQNNFHIVTTVDSARSTLINAKENEKTPFVVVAFNATLTQAEYDKLGVINFKYISVTKKIWKRVNNEITRAILSKLLRCLIRNLVDVACQFLLGKLFSCL